MEMDTKQFLNEALQKLSSIGFVDPSDIPNIDLYMDQVTSLMEEKLASSRRYDSDKILTKTMINNYAKNNLLPPPKKKKYTKEHVLMLVFIYYFKNILSISDIQKVLNPITDKYFGSDEDYSLEEIYREVFALENQETKNLMKDLAKKYNRSLSTFPDASDDEAELLRTFSFICLLSYDVFVKKTILEKLLDQI
jgi:DNA-binding transcriptional MerR regulator